MGLTIVIRAMKSSELNQRILNSLIDINFEIEVLVVCNINDYPIERIRYIENKVGRFEARIIGIKNAQYDKILFLDSDQIPEVGLIDDLVKLNCDACIIPERSLGRSLCSNLMNDWRIRIESYGIRHPSPFIPVIPRLYSKGILLKAINRLPTNYEVIIDHEDSILYYLSFPELKSISYTNKCIFNFNETVPNLLKKAYTYGKNHKNVKKIEISPELSILIRKINHQLFDVKNLGLGKGHVIQTLKAMSYGLGALFG